MKYFYIAVQIEENNKFYAYVIKVSENDNLLSKLKIENIKTANIYHTKKQADAVVEEWNKAYKVNGTYMLTECIRVYQ